MMGTNQASSSNICVVNNPHTGGRHASQTASNNSHRFSFSKTFNFHLAAIMNNSALIKN